jgi:uncharacterized DUF497 family protein
MGKLYNWNDAKNEKLKKERNISFENIVYAVEHGYLLDIIENPNQQKYPGQQMFIVEIDGYAFFVPFAETETEVFFKTIIPSRQMTKKYLGGRKS